jgi:membrane protease YdiL (CAAX protease family)
MSELEIPVQSPPEKRLPGAWIALIALFALLISNSIAGVLMGHADDDPTMTDQLSLKTVLSQRALLDRVKSYVPSGQSSIASSAATDQQIAAIASRSKAAARTSVPNARLYVVSATELKNPIDPAIVALLKNSSQAGDKALAEIYGSKKLTAARAGMLLPALPEAPFVYDLARVQAREKAGISPSGRAEISPAWKGLVLMVAGVGAFFLVGASVLVWVLFLVFRKNGTLKPKAPPADELSPADADRTIGRSTQLIASYFVIGTLVALLGGKLPESVRTIVPAALILALVFVFAKLPIGGKLISLRSIGLTKENFGKHILWGVAAFAAELPLTAALGALGPRLFPFLPPPQHPASSSLLNNPNLALVIATLVFGAAIAPFWEEIAFRGLMFPAMSKVFRGYVPGALLSSFLFAAIHPQGPTLWLSLGCVAVVSCTLVVYTRSLVPSITMHILHNLTLLLLTVLAF